MKGELGVVGRVWRVEAVWDEWAVVNAFASKVVDECGVGLDCGVLFFKEALSGKGPVTKRFILGGDAGS